MNKIPIQTTRFPEPTRVCIEASLDVIMKCNLDTFEGEQFDYIDACISMDVDPMENTVTFTSVRTIDAWRMGVPNAGRGTWVLQRDQLEAVHI